MLTVGRLPARIPAFAAHRDGLSIHEIARTSTSRNKGGQILAHAEGGGKKKGGPRPYNAPHSGPPPAHVLGWAPSTGRHQRLLGRHEQAPPKSNAHRHAPSVACADGTPTPAATDKVRRYGRAATRPRPPRDLQIPLAPDPRQRLRGRLAIF